uniref:Uncharacterized protein n=1 Tax=Megaselia scalaris TaxID=36166 RepID=T1GBE4_MEGSC
MTPGKIEQGIYTGSMFNFSTKIVKEQIFGGISEKLNGGSGQEKRRILINDVGKTSLFAVFLV